MADTFNRGGASRWMYGLISTPHRYTKLEGQAEAEEKKLVGRTHNNKRYIGRGDASAEEDPLLTTSSSSAEAAAGGGVGAEGGGRSRTPAVKWLGILAVLVISALSSVKTSGDRAIQAQSGYTDSGNSFFAQFEVLW